MDEAYVVLVADVDDGNCVCQAFPFATRAAAEQARNWFGNAFGAHRVKLIDDHEPEMEPELAGDNRSRSWDGPDVALDERAAAAFEHERLAAGLK